MLKTRISSKMVISSETNEPLNNPSTDKLKRKSFLRRSVNKVEVKPYPLKEQSGNIPSVSINLAQPQKHPSREPIQICKKELSLQKQILLKELERKEEKMEQLRLTFRKIQISRPREPKPRSPPKLKGKEGSSNRLTAYSPNIRYTATQNGQSGKNTPLS